MIFLQITQPGSVMHDTVKAVADTANHAAMAMQDPIVPMPTQDTISLFDMLIKGGYLMIPIGILSLIAVYVIVERYLSIKKASKIDENFMNNITDFVKNSNIEAAKSLCKNSTSPQASNDTEYVQIFF